MENYLSRIAVAVGLAAVLPLTAGAATSEWKIDPQHSSAQFSVRHMAMTSRPWIRASPPVTTIYAATNSLTSRTSQP